MSKKLSLPSSIMLGIAALCLIASIFLPWWGMHFIAPQYPEGLDVIVYPYKLEGKVDIINGLNHYIGMKNFSEETFPELQFLPGILVALSVLILFSAIIRKKGMVTIMVGMFGVGGFIGLYDIHRRLVDFGTNLDPKAPIKIPPFVPPVLGENKLANFITTSYFSYGSLLMGVSFLLLLGVLWRERTVKHKV